MLKIGLTGGIGSGKTTVAKLFEALGVPVIDADQIARTLVEPGKPALDAIEKAFGPDIIDPRGHLDRAALRDRVFTHRDEKKRLESILHPLVYAEIQNRLNLLNAPYAILSIPLLLETNMQNLVDRILVIDCPIEMQIKRVERRDRLSERAVRTIIDSQASRQQRLSVADDIIDNSGETGELAVQIKKLHNLYLSLSTS